ncbi:MAG: hypothetical protein IKQ55_06345 [Kiritimatiellae bacterium]|nr:hypothetical protein [Kiritimatiellia bacterium]
MEKSAQVFQRLENFFAVFPMIGKNFADFSNDWKKIFQSLENVSALDFAPPHGIGLAR